MELIIGREAGASRLRISINNQDRFWGNANSVPKSVSRQHCKVVTDDKGGYIITNLKPENVTYVNGVQIESKHISGKDRIELGADRYFMDIAAIIKGLGASIPDYINDADVTGYMA
jgi:pSer/pThr/pTyr-binding forkhead associated (FHA) protein